MPTLIFAITALHLLMNSLLYLSLQNPGARRFVVIGDLQDVCRIYPVIGSPAHDMIVLHVELVHRHIAVRSAVNLSEIISSHVQAISARQMAGALAKMLQSVDLR